MKKTMLVGIMVIAGIVFGMLIGKHAATVEKTETLPSGATIISTYLKEMHDVDAERIEYQYEPGEHHDEDYVDYIAYNDDDEIVYFGGIDLSYAYHTYTRGYY